jgi:hypothetical protein
MKIYFILLIIFLSSHPYIAEAQEGIDTTLTFKGHIGNYPDYKGIDDLMQKVETGINELLKKKTEYINYAKKNNNYFLKISCEDKNLELKFSFLRANNTTEGMRYFAGVGIIDSVEVNNPIKWEINSSLNDKAKHFYETKALQHSSYASNYFYYSKNGYEKDKRSLLIDKFLVNGESKEIYFSYSFFTGSVLYPLPMSKIDEILYKDKIKLSNKLEKPELSVFVLNNLKLQHGEARYIGSGKDGKARIYAKTVEEARLANAKNSPPTESKPVNSISKASTIETSIPNPIIENKLVITKPVLKDNQNIKWSDDPAILLKQIMLAEATIKNSKLSNVKKQEALALFIQLKKQARELIEFKKLGQKWDDALNNVEEKNKDGRIVKSILSKFLNESENNLLLKIINGEIDSDPQSRNFGSYVCGTTITDCKFCGTQIKVNKYYNSLGGIIIGMHRTPLIGAFLKETEIKELKSWLGLIRSGKYYICIKNDSELFCTREHKYLFNKR